MARNIGEVVQYHLTQDDKDKMDATSDMNSRDTLPAIITFVEDAQSATSDVNLAVFLDGSGGCTFKTYCVNSSSEGSSAGEWSYLS